VPTTGAITVSKTGGVAFAASATTDTTLTGNISYTQGGTGSVSRTVTSKLQESVSVKDFGADPTGVADSTAAIQNCINAVQTAGGGTILLSPGTYKISSSLTISGSTPLWLIGTWASIIKNVGTGNSITVGNLSADQTADVRILGIQVTGQAGTLVGINFQRMHNARIEGVRLNYHGSDGIKLQGSYACWLLNNYVNNNSGCGLNAVAISGAGNDFLQVIGNRWLANGGTAGIYIDNSLYGPQGQRIELNDVEGNTIGLKIDVGSISNTEGMTIRGNYFENQSGYNASIGEDGGTALFHNPTVDSNAFAFGTGGTSAANATRFGNIVRELNLYGNNFNTSDLVIGSSTTLGFVGGNKSNATVPGGFDQNGGVTVSQLRLYQPGGAAYSSISMTGGYIRINYPIQSVNQIFPGSANTATYQTSCGLWAGTGAPNNSYGQTGDYYFRSDTPATANQRVYVKNGGTWTGIV
jgi:hypothetical protein